MNDKVRTYRFTVKLRKKPLQGGRFSLILDYYNGNVEYLSNEQRGERIREHLGLYLIPENSPEDKERNAETMQKAMEILEKKKAELEVLKENGLQPIVKKSKDEPIELPSSLARTSNPVDEQLMVNASKCVINNINTISIHIGQRKIKDNRISLFLDCNFGTNIIYLGDDKFQGRKRKFLGLYLTDADTPEARIANSQNRLQAELILEKVIEYIKELKRLHILSTDNSESEESQSSAPPLSEDTSNTEYQDQTILADLKLTKTEEDSYHNALDKLDQLFSYM
ncbi:MAG: hypothetical protein J6C92_08960 [Bacteroidaceae bacterium]|nr:hypothetical protein [Bacteroidaceae bacterium]